MGPGLRLQPKATPKKVQAKSEVSWKWWTHSETLALIDVWGHAMADHCKTYKGKRVLPSSAYEKIAEQLGEIGISRSVEQIREKIKTLKKSFWGTLAKNGGDFGNGKINSKRQNVIERMRLVLQENGNVVKGKYTWKNDHNVEKVKMDNSKGKVQQRNKNNKRGKKAFEVLEERYEDDSSPMEALQGQENGSDDMTMGITVEPDHIHGSSEHWEQMNGENHNAGGAEVMYNYSLCQVIESIMNKFLTEQRESENRFLELENQRMKAEAKRWDTIQKRDAEMINKLLQTQERWCEEDREQEVRILTALAAKIGSLSNKKSNSKTDSKSEVPPIMIAPRSPVQWEFTGTFRPSTSSDSVPSSSPLSN